MRPIDRCIIVAGGLLLFALLCVALAAPKYFNPNGATIIVTNTDDNGPGSLRQAIADANDNDTIQFDPPLNGQAITLTSAELVIDKSITITGPGPALLSVSRNQQAPNFRIFHITPNHNVAISGLTVSDGRVETGGGGGIYNEGTLSVVNTTVTGNSTTGQASGGGGVSNQGSLTIIQSTISGNSDDDQGGGILNSGMLTISDSSVSDNHSMGNGHYGGDGGGIYNSGTVTIQSTTISGNMALGADSTRGGGGIFNSGSLTATNSTIRGNTAINGGGIFGGATIVNCTVSNNTAWIFGNAIQGSGTIANSTISGNTAIQGGGIGVLGGFIITNSTISDNGGYNIFTVTAVELGHTILKASSSGVNVGINGGSVTSHGYNLSSDNGGGFLTGPGDQINTDPILGPLQYNGGPTFTHELLAGSPAINAGDPNFTPPPLYDQRDFGYLRVYNGRIDVGSFEVQPLPTVSPTPTIPIPTPTPTPCLPVITQSTSHAITLGNSASCNDGMTHTDNSYWRAFDMNAYAGGNHYCIYSISFGVEFANSIQSVTVRLYTTVNFPAGFPGSLTQIATTTLNVGPAQNGTVVTTPLVVTVPAGTPQLVMELFTPNGQPGGHRFFVGSNAALETGASYFSAAACGATTPITTAALGFPNMHIVFDINGNCTCIPPTPSATPTPTVTPTVTPSPPPTLIVTNTNDNGPGSLRLVLDIAQDGDVIGFETALNGQTITLTSGELVINRSITIAGPGPGLLRVARDQQTPMSRIFYVSPGHAVAISGLTISGGSIESENGGGIVNDHSTLTISNCVISGNSITAVCCQVGSGGGIFNNGTLNLVNSSVASNSVNGGWAGGGGISNEGTVTITQSVISLNSSDVAGGGISNVGMLTISNSTISSNQTEQVGHFSGRGGGIYSSGALIINNSIISANRAGHQGGAVGGYGAGIYGSGTITNSTISGNSAFYQGGGIYGGGTITNTTISGNSSFQGGGIYGGGNITHDTISGNAASYEGGGIYATNPVEIGNTILKAGTSGANLVSFGTGTITSLGYNLSNDDGGGFLSGPGDLIDTDPLLGPLQNNGGPTLTHLPLEGSPAINMGDPNFTPPPSTDQRGYLRVYDGRIDIGSVEVQSIPTPTPTPTPTLTPTPTGTPPPSTIQALNISTRLRVETGNNRGIGGFIIQGAGSLRIAIRGLGPSLSQLGVPDPLADPVLEGLNDNWQDDPSQAAQLMKLGLAPTNPLESASVLTLTSPIQYTAVLAGKEGGTGVGLVEVYNVDQSVPLANIELANISTRGFVQTGNDVMIGGFILGGGNNGTGIVLRGIGPSLSQFGIPNALADPTLELRDQNGGLLVANDNWEDDPASAAQLTAHGLAPQNPLEAGIYSELQPGLYTGILAGQESGTGVGLVEIYNVH